MSVEAQLQSATAAYQKLQTDVAKLINSRQQLDAQLAENRSVKSAFDSIPSSPSSSSAAEQHVIYKLVGPVLLKQETAEARGNVERRLEFLTAEMKRVDERIKSSQSTIDAKKLELVHLQSQLQQQAQPSRQPDQPATPGTVPVDA